MRIVIFSGGSGSAHLQMGIKRICPEVHITNIINAYDDGKSTGVARKVMDVLGPSDIRKNQFVQYMNKTEEKHMNIIDFYCKRFNIPSDDPISFCIEKLRDFDLYNSMFTYAIYEFFKHAKKKGINNFSDFGFPNIIYSAMFKACGYKATINWFKDFLGITDDIILNSYDNLVLHAITKNNNILIDEASIVDYNNANDPIDKVLFVTDEKELAIPELNTEVIDPILEADLIIFSSGTQWASLIPTYMTPGISELIEYSNAKKIFVVNNSDDSDMCGINAEEMINIVSKYVNLENFSFLYNSDADDIMKMKRCPIKNNFNCLSASMININGKHDHFKIAKEIFGLYFDNEHNYFGNILKSKLSIIYADFDDTLFARDKNLQSISYDNLKLFQELSNDLKCVIVSGNSYKHLNEKSRRIYGEDFREINCDVYAASIVKYKNGITPYLLYDYWYYGVSNIEQLLHYLHYRGFTNIECRPKEFPICLTIKGLEEKERKELVKELRDINITPLNTYLIAGKTSIDIKHRDVDKYLVSKNYTQLNLLNSVCITDILDIDKDTKLMETCKFRIIVKNAIETKIVLTLLNGEINGI